MCTSILCYVGLAVLIVTTFIVFWMWYMGMLKTIQVEVREIPEMTIFNMNYTGSMQDCSKGCVDMEKRTKEFLPGMPVLPKMGSAYYTTPSQVQNQEENRWSCFFILDDNKELLERAKQLPESDEYSLTTIPAMKAIYATFPHRTNLSFMFGPMKVYPAITKFMNENKLVPYGCFEIYHFNHEPIEYIMFLENKEIFDDLQKTKFVAANLL